jgi:peptidoglycan/LPS O-acetylase OafA/YrhL
MVRAFNPRADRERNLAVMDPEITTLADAARPETVVAPPALPQAPPVNYTFPPVVEREAPAPATAVERAAEPVWLWRGTIPTLNGLRAGSILLVISSHMAHKHDLPLPWIPGSGEIGVEMFFVISGFLITLLLLREHRRTGQISLQGFYVRRLLRIVPAYGAYLGCLFLLQCIGVVEYSWRSWLPALTYTSSLGLNPEWDLSHTWSLSVEEHFYLVWPLLLLLLGPRKAFRVALGCVCLMPVVRLALAYAFDPALPAFNRFTPTRLDALAAGCCLAFLATSPVFRARTRWANGWMATVALLGVVSLFVVLQAVIRHPGWLGLKGSEVIPFVDRFVFDSIKPVLMATLIWICVVNSRRWFGRILNARPIAFVGILSYSLYLWQQPFLNPNRDHWTCEWPAKVILFCAAALASYFVIERPFLKLKERFKG